MVAAVAESKSPGSVVLVGNLAETFFLGSCGFRVLTPAKLPAEDRTPYDLASLTKVVATTTAVMLLRDDGRLDLDQPVYEILPIPAFSKFTIRHCLTHTAGLVSSRPYYRDCSSLNEMLQRYAERDPEWAPGTKRRYSDVGFMILGKVVELAAGESLEAFCAKRIFGPLGMRHTTFNPPKAWARACAATESCAWRDRVIAGVVHDENAYASGGVAGHAGLFSTAGDLAVFCRALLNGKLFRKETLDEITRLGQTPHYPWQGLGWRLDPWASASDGFLPSRAAMGHTGWTGTSLWIDLGAGLFAIQLGNTCHPSRDHRDNRTFRQTFYQGVSRALYPNQSNTHTGLDRLVLEQFDRVRGKRIALLTNHAAVDQLGRAIVDVLGLEPTIEVRFLYSPEHGLWGQAEAGEKAPSERGNIPAISLYGDRKQPSKGELAKIDLFIVDLQDVGTRYYTYMATMMDCMAACANAGKPVLVLDRPNPIGGEILEGPIAATTSSDVCCAPIPVRHGMTMGELAVFFLRTRLRGSGLSLTVSELDGWPRDRLFSECALPWISPSPNMPTPETALLYVGMCLFEGTNLNEGRGTETPFHVLGAPWLNAEAVVEHVAPEERAGCTLEPISYKPISIPGKAASPRYCGETCQGIRITIQAPRQVRAFTLAAALLSAIRRLHPDEFAWKESFDILAGGPSLRKAIERGDSAREIVTGYDLALERFDRKRPRLYD